MLRLLNNVRGFTDIVLVAAVTVVLAVGSAYLFVSTKSSGTVDAETRHDLKSITDRLALAFTNEQECRTAFTSAPLNALNFTGGNAGTTAMELTSISSLGQALVTVGDPIVGGTVGRVFLENKLLLPDIGPYKNYMTNLRVVGATSSRLPLSSSIKLGVLVDAANKVQYCYVEESVAIKTCRITGGFFDPTQVPQCRYSFSGISCADPRSCMTGLNTSGGLLCSNRLQPTPTPAPPPAQCYCACTPTWAGPNGACGWYRIATNWMPSDTTAFSYSFTTNQGYSMGDVYIDNPDPQQDLVIVDIADLVGCVLSSTGPPIGCP